MIGVQDEVNNTQIYGEYIPLNLPFIKAEICKNVIPVGKTQNLLLPV
jgi:hypothetical protein